MLHNPLRQTRHIVDTRHTLRHRQRVASGPFPEHHVNEQLFEPGVAVSGKRRSEAIQPGLLVG